MIAGRFPGRAARYCVDGQATSRLAHGKTPGISLGFCCLFMPGYPKQTLIFSRSVSIACELGQNGYDRVRGTGGGCHAAAARTPRGAGESVPQKQ
jgi:hypothetical protein